MVLSCLALVNVRTQIQKRHVVADEMTSSTTQDVQKPTKKGMYMNSKFQSGNRPDVFFQPPTEIGTTRHQQKAEELAAKQAAEERRQEEEEAGWSGWSPCCANVCSSFALMNHRWWRRKRSKVSWRICWKWWGGWAKPRVVLLLGDILQRYYIYIK